LPGSAEAYACATLLVALASLLRWGLGFVTEDLQAFTTFYPAVLFASLWGGARVGIFAALLGGIISWWAFLPPYSVLWPPSRGDEINLLTFFVASVLIVWATDHYRRLTKRLQDEENLRELAVDELAHRLKNKVATIQAIVSLRLREHSQLRDEIADTLTALTSTDELITKTQGQGARINDILSTELAPYDLSRVSAEGPYCLLSPKLALTMALLVHELATNAAKYGALSSSAGKLSINWSLSGTRLNLEWHESGGPPVNPPSHSGFGTRLFLRALDQFRGKVDATFASTGFACKLSVDLPETAPSSVPDATGKEIESM
jgi:two-component sensor histidine kinase